MQKFLKNLFKEHYLFLAILLIALFLRLYHIQTLTTFGRDQGIDFSTVREMVLFHKWTLIGIKTSIGEFFQGPIYLYMLYPAFLILKLDPIAGAITAVFISFLTLALIYYTLTKFYTKKAGILASLIYAVSPQLVIYGTTPLYQNFLPLFIVASIYFYLSIKGKKDFLNFFLLGLSVGLGMELHLLNIISAVSFLIILLVRKYFKPISTYFLGVIFGFSPTILFELRHQFLNTHLFLSQFGGASLKELPIIPHFQQLVQGIAIFLAGNSTFLALLVLIFIIASLFLAKFEPKQKDVRDLVFITFLISIGMALKFNAYEPHYLLPFLIMSIFYLSLTPLKRVGLVLVILLSISGMLVTISNLNNDHGYNMPKGWNMYKIKTSASIISKDVNSNQFEVASLLDGDTRTYPVRYMLSVDGKPPMEVTDYPKAKLLYVLARGDKRILFPDVWEISSLGPAKVIKSWNLGDGIDLYKLGKK